MLLSTAVIWSGYLLSGEFLGLPTEIRAPGLLALRKHCGCGLKLELGRCLDAAVLWHVKLPL
jgi:hypothetical protein